MLRRNRNDYLKKKSEAYFDPAAESNKVILLCYDIILDKVRSSRRESPADIGYGTGGMLFRIQQDHGDRFQLYGLDISAESLKITGEKSGRSAVFNKGDAEHIPDGRHSRFMDCRK